MAAHPPNDSAKDNNSNDRANTAGYQAGSAARLFDLRTVLALLFAVYGIVLVIMGIVATSETDMTKTGGISLNLWSGVAMLAVAALFILWVWLRPLAREGQTEQDGP